jgi:ATP-dependent DNA helicase RecQ
LQGRTLHSTSVYDFEQFQQEAKFLCGHNILAHDLPILKATGASDGLLRRQFNDTLYLSPFFFSYRPYHRLVKGYRLMSEHYNNPVEDSKIAADLLKDCLIAYYSMPEVLRRITRL